MISRLKELPPAQLACALVLGALALQLLFNLTAAAFGWGYPYTIFTFKPGDRFGDFFKLAFSYPGPPIVEPSEIWGISAHLDSLAAAVRDNPMPALNHFHVPPLPTLLALTWRQGMSVIDPVALYAIVITACVALLAYCTSRLAADRADRIALALLAVACYPVLMAVDRGHVFSLVCGIALIAGLNRAERNGRPDLIALMLLAVALNIRPNVIVLPAGLWMCQRGWRMRDLIALGAFALVLFALSMAAANAIYPDYTLTSFRRGLADYAGIYLGRDFGVPFGSSLFGALKALAGNRPWLLQLPVAIGVCVVAATMLAARRGLLDGRSVLFLLASTYAVVTHIFADYHLLVFLLPVAMLASAGRPISPAQWIVLLASCFVLAPKNYAYGMLPDGQFWSWQIVANPLILILAALAILALAAARRRQPKDRHLGSAGMSAIS